MARFESEKKMIHAPSIEVYDFVSDFRNFEKIMPDQIANWRADERSCAFTIPGMADLAMRIQSKVEGRSVHIVSENPSPVSFKLDVFVQSQRDTHCNAEIVIEAELSPFVSMLASKPLQNLVDLMAKHLKEHFEKSP